MRRLAPLALAVLLPTTADAALPEWRRLEFHASKLIFTATTEIEIGSATAVGGDLIACPSGRAIEPADETLFVRIHSRVAGRVSSSEVWFAGADGAALQRRKLREGRKAYQKTYRFAREGVYSHRAAPADDAESRRPPAAWSATDETFYDHPEGLDCTAISEPSVLFYLLSRNDFEATARGLCVFSGKALNRVEVRRDGRAPLTVDYVERRDGAERRVQRQVESLRVLVRPAGDADFELLGLEGEIEIYLDPTSRLPLLVQGRIPPLGRVQVRLAEATLDG